MASPSEQQGELHPKPGAAKQLDSLLHSHEHQQQASAGAAAGSTASGGPHAAATGADAPASPALPAVHVLAAPVAEEAHVPGSPRSPRALSAARPHVGLHRPALPEKELGVALRPDRSDRLGHPGVACEDLPPSHAHK